MCGRHTLKSQVADWPISGILMVLCSLGAPLRALVLMQLLPRQRMASGPALPQWQWGRLRGHSSVVLLLLASA